MDNAGENNYTKPNANTQNAEHNANTNADENAGTSNQADSSTVKPKSNAKGKLRTHFSKSVQRAFDATNAFAFLNKTRIDLEGLLEVLNENWDAYKKEYATTFNDDNDQDADELIEAEYVGTEECYLTTRSRIRERIAELAHAAQPLAIQQPNALTTIVNSWGHFNGNHAEWPGFRDEFKAKIYNHQDISITLKWNYLYDSLSGDALAIMGSLMHADEDLANAWERLCHRYDDHYKTVHTLIQKIMDIEKIEHASSNALRCISDTVNNCLTQISNYISTDNWDQLVIYCVMDKLDDQTQAIWEQSRISIASQPDANAPGPSNEPVNADANKITLPTWAQLKHFLDNRANALTNVRQSKLNAEASSFVIIKSRAANNANHSQIYANRGQHTQKQAYTNSGLPPCSLCRIKHATFSCPTWLEMCMDDREAFRLTHRLCITCCQPDHGNAPCWGKPDWIKPCPTCLKAGENIFHNSTLCRRSEAKRLAKQLAQTTNAGHKQ